MQQIHWNIERSKLIREQFIDFAEEIENLYPSVSKDLAEVSRLQGCAEEIAEALLTALDINTNAATAALELIDQLQRKNAELEEEKKRIKLLAVFRDPISIIRDLIAMKMGFTHWAQLAAQLGIEKWSPSQLTQAKLEQQLAASGLHITIWNHLCEVAGAANSEFHRGKEKSPMEVLQMVRSNCIPKDLLYTKPSLDQAFAWLAKEVQAQ